MIGPKTILVFVLALLLASGSGFFYGKHVESVERDADLLQDAQVAYDLYVAETKRSQALGKQLTEAQNANVALASQLAKRFSEASTAPAPAGSCVNDKQLRIIQDAFRGPAVDSTGGKPRSMPSD